MPASRSSPGWGLPLELLFIGESCVGEEKDSGESGGLVALLRLPKLVVGRTSSGGAASSMLLPPADAIADRARGFSTPAERLANGSSDKLAKARTDPFCQGIGPLEDEKAVALAARDGKSRG